jgi:hypothetical protein
VRREATEAAPLGFFKGGRFNLGKRPASSYFRSRWRALVAILVSHLSAKNADGWGTLLLGEGEMEWVGILGDARSLGCAQDDNSEGSRGRLVPMGVLRHGHADRSVRATRMWLILPFLDSLYVTDYIGTNKLSSSLGYFFLCDII